MIQDGPAPPCGVKSLDRPHACRSAWIMHTRRQHAIIEHYLLYYWQLTLVFDRVVVRQTTKDKNGNIDLPARSVCIDRQENENIYIT